MHHGKLVERLRQGGFRLTRQRAIILEALSELDGHASAEEVHARVRLHCPDIDLSTVYRTLETLRDLRVVSVGDLGQGCVQYELMAGEPHHHLICRQCGHVTVLGHAYMESVAAAIRQDFDFEPIFDHFAVFGLCGECRKGE